MYKVIVGFSFDTVFNIHYIYYIISHCYNNVTAQTCSWHLCLPADNLYVGIRRLKFKMHEFETRVLHTYIFDTNKLNCYAYSISVLSDLAFIKQKIAKCDDSSCKPLWSKAPILSSKLISIPTSYALRICTTVSKVIYI